MCEVIFTVSSAEKVTNKAERAAAGTHALWANPEAGPLTFDPDDN